MKEHKKIPELRFPKFSEEWNIGKIQSFNISIIDGDRGANYPSSADFLENGYCLFLNAKNVTKRGFKFDDLAFINQEKDSAMSKGKLVRGDIVLTTRGSLGHIAIYNEKIPFDNIRINSGMVIIRCKEEIDPNYAYMFFNNHKFQRNIDKISFGSAQPQLTVTGIKKLYFSSPVKKEQQKIADFLSAVDEKIEKLNKKKELLEQYKKGLMQQIFSQKLRFKDDNGNPFPAWEEKKLGDLLDYEQPTKYLVSSTEYSNEHEIPVLTAGKTFILGYTSETFGIYKEKLPTIIFDDFTTAFHYVDFPFKAKSSAMKMLTPKNKSDNLIYLYAVMKQIKFALGEHKRYWIAEYQNEIVLYASQEEQKKIADFLSAVDKKIEKLTEQIEQANLFKKSLLQKMFV